MIKNRRNLLSILKKFYPNEKNTPMDKARKAYGFKYDASFIKALSLFKDEDKEQLHKRYFKDFYAYKENVLIRKFVNKEELKEHCKMEDILHQYFSIDKILNFIKKEKLNNNISSTIKRDLVTINSIYKKMQ